MRPVWRFFGHDEPNYTYMKDGKKLLGQLAALSPEPVYIRTHNLLTSGDGTPALKWGSTGVYTEDAEGRPRYDWTILDRIFDTYKERGVRPYVQIGFMPEALSTQPEPYQHRLDAGRQGRRSRPAGPTRRRTTRSGPNWSTSGSRHSSSGTAGPRSRRGTGRSGTSRTSSTGGARPRSTTRLYDYAVDAVKRALPTARVGGPHVAGTKSPEATKFLRDFLEHCLRGKNHATGKTGSPLDFIAFHAKGAPRFVEGTSRRGSPPSSRTSTGASRSWPATPS